MRWTCGGTRVELSCQKKSPRSASAERRPTLFDGTAGIFDRAVGEILPRSCREFFACRDVFPMLFFWTSSKQLVAPEKHVSTTSILGIILAFQVAILYLARQVRLFYAHFHFILIRGLSGCKICHHVVRRTEIHPRGSRTPRAGYRGPYARRAKTGMSFHATIRVS